MNIQINYEVENHFLKSFFLFFPRETSFQKKWKWTTFVLYKLEKENYWLKR